MPIYSKNINFKFFSLLTFSLFCFSQNGYADESSIEHLIAGKKIAGFYLTHISEISAFYHERKGLPLWVDGEHYTVQAQEILSDFANSWEQGLNPSNYHVAEFKNTLHGEEADVLFTDTVIRYANDLAGMRLSPRTLGEDENSWSRGVNAEALLKSLAIDREPAVFLRYLAPQDKTYVLLKSALKALVEDMAKHPEETFKPVRYTGILRPNSSAKAILNIRERLNVPAEKNADARFYDEKLRDAVMAFQKENGLKADGLIGRRSFAAINQTREQKLVKILANLERRRWVRRAMPERYVAVNIPAMLLRAIDKNEVVFEMPVIVGRAQRPSISFVDEIIGVRFNPSWYVPDTIKNEDYLPALQKDPEALAQKGMKFRVKFADGTKELLSSDIDWVNMTPSDLSHIQMVQGPGAANVLGRIRIMMPNRYDIYLHDTSAPELFAKDDRALSSGCIRLSEPRKIANFVLENNPDWSNDRLESYLKKDNTIEIVAKNPVPVYLFYYTAWQDADDHLILGDDLYGLDSKLVYLLQEAGKIPFAIRLPVPQKVKKS